MHGLELEPKISSCSSLFLFQFLSTFFSIRFSILSRSFLEEFRLAGIAHHYYPAGGS